MEEEKLIDKNEEAVQEADAALDVQADENAAEEIKADDVAVGNNSQEVEDLTEEERLEKARKEKRAERLQPLKYFLFACSAGVIQFVSALVIKIILDKFISPDVEIHFITNLKETTFIADTIGLALSIIWNFTFNRKFTFKDAGNVPLAMALAFLFYVPFYPFQIWYIDTIE